MFKMEHPIIIILTTILSLITVANNLTNILGVVPFWSDLFLSALLLISGVYWGWLLISKHSNQSKSQCLVNHLGEEIVTPRKLIIKADLNLIPPVFSVIIIFALLIWTSYYPVRHLLNAEWNICGSVTASCPHYSCVYLSDEKHRLSVNECIPTQDDSGYISFASDKWWIYKPKYISSNCGIDNKVVIKNSLLSKKCNGFMEIP